MSAPPMVNAVTLPMLAGPDLHAEQAGQRSDGAGGERPAPPLLLRGLAGHDRRADEPAAQALQRLGREQLDAPRRKREPCPLVVEPRDERREDLASDPARPDAVAGVASAVVETLAGDGAEEGQVVGGDVDRAAPGALDPSLGAAGQQPPQARLGAARSRPVAAETVVDPAAEADRARAAPHQDPPVARRAEVVHEHAPVDDRLAPGPADLLDELRDRLRQDDVRA